MEIVEALEAAAASVRERLAATLAKRDDLNSRVGELEIEQRGIESAIAHHREPSRPAVTNGWTGMPRVQAIEKMLALLGKPIAPRQLVQHLAGVGRNDSGTAVGAALAYLHQMNRVKSLGRGQWVLVTYENEGPKDEIVSGEPRT